jgi:hypothetical protein
MVVCQVFPFLPCQVELNAKTSRYMRFLGFEQSYAVFAKPVHVNKHMFGIITYQSGLTELFSYPRIEQFNILDKMRYERFRKFFSDNLERKSLIHCRSDFARYVARLYARPNDAPYSVSLITVSSPIPPPHQQLVDETPASFSQSSVFINYFVQPEDLL